MDENRKKFIEEGLNIFYEKRDKRRELINILSKIKNKKLYEKELERKNKIVKIKDLINVLVKIGNKDLYNQIVIIRKYQYIKLKQIEQLENIYDDEHNLYTLNSIVEDTLYIFDSYKYIRKNYIPIDKNMLSSYKNNYLILDEYLTLKNLLTIEKIKKDKNLRVQDFIMFCINNYSKLNKIKINNL